MHSIALKRGLSIVTLMCALTMHGQAWTQSEDGDKGNRDTFGKMEEKLFEDTIAELHLSTGQQDEIRKQRTRQGNAAQKLRQKLRVAMEEMRKELEKEQTDMRKLKSLVGEVKKYQGELLEVRVDGILETKKVLTPEQFSLLMEKTEKLRRERRWRMHSESQ